MYAVLKHVSWANIVSIGFEVILFNPLNVRDVFTLIMTFVCTDLEILAFDTNNYEVFIPQLDFPKLRSIRLGPQKVKLLSEVRYPLSAKTNENCPRFRCYPLC